HDAARTHANARGGAGHMSDQHRGGGAGDALHAVVLGHPETIEAPAFGVLRYVHRVRQRFGYGTTFGDRAQIEKRERDHGKGNWCCSPETSRCPSTTRAAEVYGCSIRATGLRRDCTSVPCTLQPSE